MTWFSPRTYVCSDCVKSVSVTAPPDKICCKETEVISMNEGLLGNPTDQEGRKSRWGILGQIGESDL
jgi:hypothetical protein